MTDSEVSESGDALPRGENDQGKRRILNYVDDGDGLGPNIRHQVAIPLTTDHKLHHYYSQGKPSSVVCVNCGTIFDSISEACEGGRWESCLRSEYHGSRARGEPYNLSFDEWKSWRGSRMGIEEWEAQR